jgi:hypothetical protein
MNQKLHLIKYNKIQFIYEPKIALNKIQFITCNSYMNQKLHLIKYNKIQFIKCNLYMNQKLHLIKCNKIQFIKCNSWLVWNSCMFWHQVSYLSWIVLSALSVNILFITIFTRFYHLSLSWDRLIQSMPSCSTTWRPCCFLFLFP